MANDDEGPGTTESSPPFLVFVTGFGPFHNVHSNPTTTIAEKIVGHLRARESALSKAAGDPPSMHHPPRLSLVTRTEVIETSAQAAHETIDRFYQELRASSSISTSNGESSTTNNTTSTAVPSAIFLHLGVNEGGAGFQLESCAYNEATFRLPDERGHRPLHEPIVRDMKLHAPLHTSLDVPALVSRLNAGPRTHPAVQTCRQSHDPGRYVCNYTYFLSLHRCHELRKSIPGAKVHCLFLHVPPFRRVPEHEQLEFVGRLLQLLQQQVSDSSLLEAS